MKLPLALEEARVLRNEMWSLLSFSVSFRRVYCRLLHGGSLVVERTQRTTKLQLTVNRSTAFAAIVEVHDIDEILSVWWKTFGRVITGGTTQ